MLGKGWTNKILSALAAYTLVATLASADEHSHKVKSTPIFSPNHTVGQAVVLRNPIRWLTLHSSTRTRRLSLFGPTQWDPSGELLTSHGHATTLQELWTFCAGSNINDRKRLTRTLWVQCVFSIFRYSNRQETYEYFQLPYCKGKGEVEHRHETLGEALLGMELVNSGIPIRFGSKASSFYLSLA